MNQSPKKERSAFGMSTSVPTKMKYLPPTVRSFPITSDFVDLSSDWVHISEVAERFLQEHQKATRDSTITSQPLTKEALKSLRKALDP